ncbi:MAG: hypothetical protein ACRD8Z_15810, partial [Nitrososphaeraceae archaeon]
QLWVWESFRSSGDNWLNNSSRLVQLTTLAVANPIFVLILAFFIFFKVCILLTGRSLAWNSHEISPAVYFEVKRTLLFL